MIQSAVDARGDGIYAARDIIEGDIVCEFRATATVCDSHAVVVCCMCPDITFRLCLQVTEGPLDAFLLAKGDSPEVLLAKHNFANNCLQVYTTHVYYTKRNSNLPPLCSPGNVT